MTSFTVLLYLISVFICKSEITILKSVQTLYDRSPKLRIKGSGFDADEHSIILDLSANNQASLKVDKDYLITKDDEGLILKLLSNRRWVNLDERTPPVALILRGVSFESDPKKNLLLDEVIVANVLPTPTVDENDEKVMYQTATNELRINGTGFVGAKKVDLFFKPPIFKEVAYEIVSPFPLSRDTVILRLRHNYKWREEPGPLYVVGVDTGGGPVKLNGDSGILIADVQADLDLHTITVQATATEQLIYNDDARITIKGTGFNPSGNTMRFANGILGKGLNYTTKSTTEEKITLTLVPGSHWRKNAENLPGYLTLLAVNAGEGFVAVGPMNSGKGKDIATVFERPDVFSSNTKLFKTHSHELHITGVGFTKVLSQTELKFDPPLKQDVDYTIKVIDRTNLEITLMDGKQWRKDNGPLIVKAINTRGDDNGWIDLDDPNGVHVAEIVDDIDAEDTGGVEVFPMGVKVYQSVKQNTISITGSGFKTGVSFTFDPPLKDGDFDFDIESKNKINLTLKQGKKWRDEPGFLVIKQVKIDTKTYNLGGTDGIRVATVLADPVINAGKDSFHETQSKVIAITGHGFTNVADTKIVVRPTLPGAYKVLAVLEDTIRIQLKQGSDWLPSFVTLKDDTTDKKIPIQITSIDTGAGVVEFDNPIVVGFIVKDREGVVCDDSCEFAFDGVCDDGTENEYYQDYGYVDDDLGGYYEDKDEEGQGYAYDDYYANDEYKVSACVEGTDCTDCGGVDAIVDYAKLVNDPKSGVVACDNSCPYARDGVCDDPRGANYCKLGSDCQDCGPVGSDNFTKSDDDGWWDDDDDYWTFNDGNFLDQTAGLQKNWDKVKRVPRSDTVGAAAMFLVVLEGMVYTVGAIFAAAALYLGMRYYNGQSMPCMNVFDAEMSARDLELAPTKRMPITPDVIRT